MTNQDIADLFALYGKLLDLHDLDAIKAKTYAAASFRIEKLPIQLSEVNSAERGAQDGIGKSIAKKIEDILSTGTFPELQQIISDTPGGLFDMLKIKGLGPKKVRIIWKELGLTTPGELEYACLENRLSTMKGFGEKTQQSILENIRFLKNQVGKFHYATAEQWVPWIEEQLQTSGLFTRWQITGDFRRNMEVVETLEWVAEPKAPGIFPFGQWVTDSPELWTLKMEGLPICKIHLCKPEYWGNTLFISTGPEDHTTRFVIEPCETEETIYQKSNWPFIPPEMRDGSWVQQFQHTPLPKLIEDADLKGVVHNHSTWSDGIHSLREMAMYAKKCGWEYLVICDHSRTASYANGLSVERVMAQWEEIKQLNIELAPFRIFKGIESDILGDGSLDYPEEVLKGFEVIVASIHQNLSMTQEKSEMRLIKAIENPYTRILGHLTGRLLLSREGYPIHHRKIMEACIANNVDIELNAHPYRLDMDWRYIREWLDMGGKISINPDAHQKEGYHDMRYGVKVARKAGVTALDVINAYDLTSFSNWVSNKK